MEEPIFRTYGVDDKKFWEEVENLPQKYQEEQQVKVNPETIYMNHMIHYVKRGIFKGLNNKMLHSFGERLSFYPGVPEIFRVTRDLIEADAKYAEYSIKVEHYIVSTGLAEIIRGSAVMPYVTNVWGCEFIEDAGENGDREISEVGYTIDTFPANTSPS